MAIVNFFPSKRYSCPHENYVTNESHVMDALNEMAAVVGYVCLQDGGAAGTRTISQAGGGKILLRQGAVTFATASTTIRTGIEDIGAGGLPDGTQDVFCQKVAGTDTITPNVYAEWTMTSGSKTLTHNQFIAITTRMTVRAGADSVVVGSFTTGLIAMSTAAGTSASPYGVLNGSKGDEILFAIIIFDDGSLGWIQNTPCVLYPTVTAQNLQTSTNPDEVAGTFQVPVVCEAEEIGFILDNYSAAGDDFELILYEDPFGTPNALATKAVDSSEITFASASTQSINVPITRTQLNPGTTYAVALRCTGGNFDTYFCDIGNFGYIKRLVPFLGFNTEIKYVGRQDQTGAFSEITTGAVPLFQITICGFDDGSGGGGGAFAYAFPG